jgi:hypothetical protein
VRGPPDGAERGPGKGRAASECQGGADDSAAAPAPQANDLQRWMAKRAAWWRLAEGASLEEIGRRLGCSASTVTTLVGSGGAL